MVDLYSHNQPIKLYIQEVASLTLIYIQSKLKRDMKANETQIVFRMFMCVFQFC